jgi:hypothetical protein
VFTAALFISVFRFVIAALARMCAPGDEALNKNPSLKNFNRALFSNFAAFYAFWMPHSLR